MNQAPTDSIAAIDTVVIDQPVGVWVKVSASQRSVLYLSMAIMGYTSGTDLLYPLPGAGEDAVGRIQPIELNRWVRIQGDLYPSRPAGLEVLKVLVDSDQYSLKELVATFGCERTRGDLRRANPDAPVQGWTTVEHRIMILTARPEGRDRWPTDRTARSTTRSPLTRPEHRAGSGTPGTHRIACPAYP